MSRVMSSGSSEVKYISSPVTGMHEAQRHGMQGLARTNVKAVVYKLFVFGKMSSFQYFVPPVAFVVEEHVADVFHVHTYLVRTPRFEDTLHQRDIAESLQYAIVGHGMLALALGQDRHLQPVFRIASDVAYNRPLVLLHVAPYQG